MKVPLFPGLSSGSNPGTPQNAYGSNGSISARVYQNNNYVSNGQSNNAAAEATQNYKLINSARTRKQPSPFFHPGSANPSPSRERL